MDDEEPAGMPWCAGRGLLCRRMRRFAEGVVRDLHRRLVFNVVGLAGGLGRRSLTITLTKSLRASVMQPGVPKTYAARVD